MSYIVKTITKPWAYIVQLVRAFPTLSEDLVRFPISTL